MKPKLALAWFVVSLALTALLVVNWRHSSDQKRHLEKVQLQVETLIQKDKASAAQTADLQKENQKLRAELRATELDLNDQRLTYNAMLSMTNAPRGTALPGTAAAPDAQRPNSGGMATFFNSMMKDPEMRKVMEQQQRIGIDMMYGSLCKQLQLTPEQEKSFKDSLLAMQMTNMNQAGAMFDQSNTNRAALMQKMTEDRRHAEEKIKEVLGEEKFTQYQDYNQTLGERMMLDQFTKQTQVTPDQTEQLLAIMREEKKNVQINNAADPSDPAKDWQKVMDSGEAAERAFARQEQVNERVLERAAQILTPEQMEKFRPALTNQIAMQRAGLKMARQLMQGTPPSPTPSP